MAAGNVKCQALWQRYVFCPFWHPEATTMETENLHFDSFVLCAFSTNPVQTANGKCTKPSMPCLPLCVIRFTVWPVSVCRQVRERSESALQGLWWAEVFSPVWRDQCIRWDIEKNRHTVNTTGIWNPDQMPSSMSFQSCFLFWSDVETCKG